MFFMSTACGGLQGGGGPAPVDRGVKNLIFGGRHKWMAPNTCTSMQADTQTPGRYADIQADTQTVRMIFFKIH